MQPECDSDVGETITVESVSPAPEESLSANRRNWRKRITAEYCHVVRMLRGEANWNAGGDSNPESVVPAGCALRDPALPASLRLDSGQTVGPALGRHLDGGGTRLHRWR